LTNMGRFAPVFLIKTIVFVDFQLKKRILVFATNSNLIRLSSQLDSLNLL